MREGKVQKARVHVVSWCKFGIILRGCYKAFLSKVSPANSRIAKSEVLFSSFAFTVLCSHVKPELELQFYIVYYSSSVVGADASL